MNRIWYKVNFEVDSEFSFFYSSYHTKVKELSLAYYLFIAWGRIVGYIPFWRVLALCKIQTASFRIWTQVAMFISDDDNHYITSTPIKYILFQLKLIYILFKKINNRSHFFLFFFFGKENYLLCGFYLYWAIY